MTRLTWGSVGQRLFETGVDHGVLYIPTNGVYDKGYAWNGLTAVTESPSGAESNKQYADNGVYLNLVSAEEFGGTLEAFMYPDEFAQCDGTAVVYGGVSVGQQGRRTFGLSYRTKVGSDSAGQDFGYKLHLVYGCLAAPSEKAYSTVNDSPEAMGLSWTLSTTPVQVPGNDPNTGKPFKDTAILTIDSTKVSAVGLAALEDALYGTPGVDPRLPLPAEVFAFFSGTVTEVAPVAPTFNANTITIPTVAGVVYYIDGEIVSGAVPITTDTVVYAEPSVGYKFPAVSDNDWLFVYV